MADELINLVEYAKGHPDPVASALIELFAAESDVVQTMRFKTVRQGINVFDRETSIPAVAFRALNAESEISYGTQERLQDQCYPISGLIEFDRILRKRYGDGKRMANMKGQMKAGSRLWTDTFINGNNASDPRTFDGLKSRLKATGTGATDVDGSKDDSRLIANNTAAGGGPLSLAKLDLAVDQVNSATHIICSRKLRTRFKAAARDPNLTNNRVTDDYDSNLGRRVLRFGDLPLLVGYEVSKQSVFLPFNEVAWGGGAAVTTSIYTVSFREDGLCGIQTSPPEYVPVDTDRGVFERDLFEWDCGITLEDPYAADRLSSITDAPIVA